MESKSDRKKCCEFNMSFRGQSLLIDVTTIGRSLVSGKILIVFGDDEKVMANKGLIHHEK